MEEHCMTGLSKFDELSIKTSTQLAQVINNELDLGIRTAHQALESADNWAAPAKASYLKAQQAYAAASRLIPATYDFTKDQRSQMELRLDLLRKLLVGLSVIGSTPTPTEDQITALARALWEARGRPEGFPEEDWFRAERALQHGIQAHVACAGNY
jgi:hypothetical protein